MRIIAFAEDAGVIERIPRGGGVVNSDRQKILPEYIVAKAKVRVYKVY